LVFEFDFTIIIIFSKKISVYGSYSVASTATLTSAMQAAASELSEKESVGRGTIGIFF